MTVNDLFGIAHLVILSGAVLLLILIVSLYRSHVLVLTITLLALAGACASLLLVSPDASAGLQDLLGTRGYPRFYTGLLLSASIPVALLLHGYLRNRDEEREEMYILLILATAGACIIAASRHFATLFLGLEILSVSLYVMIAYVKEAALSVEAGIKYLMLAAVSSAFLLFGIALVYAETGTMEFSGIASGMGAGGRYFYPGMALISVGLGFKLAVVPFHLWTPDVYQGAPAPVTAYIAAVSKGGVVAVLAQLFRVLRFNQHPALLVMFGLMAAVSMFAGNLLALRQDNVKRMLAYSSIAHVGYLLVALVAGGEPGAQAAAFYLASYIAATLCAFGAVTALSGPDRDAESIDDYRGLIWRRPWLAALFTAALLSLAGIPLTAGFIAKYYAALAGVRAYLWVLVAVLIVNSVIGMYYYLRVLAAMYSGSPAAGTARERAPSLTIAGAAALAVVVILLLWAGVYPRTLLDIIAAVAGG